MVIKFIRKLKDRRTYSTICKSNESLPTMSQFIFWLRLDFLPHSYISETDPSIFPVILQSFDTQTFEFFRDFGFDSAITDFPVITPRSVGEVFAQDGPNGVVVAHFTV